MPIWPELFLEMWCPKQNTPLPYPTWLRAAVTWYTAPIQMKPPPEVAGCSPCPDNLLCFLALYSPQILDFSRLWLRPGHYFPDSGYTHQLAQPQCSALPAQAWHVILQGSLTWAEWRVALASLFLSSLGPHSFFWQPHQL